MAPLETFELGISVFSFDEDYTYSLLEPVFSGLCHGADYERLSEKNQKRFSSELDKCHLQSIDPADCDGYIDSLLQLCSVITRECTGKDFQQWQLGEAALSELRKAWRHFVHLISVRDFDWENLQDLDGEKPGDKASAKLKMLRFVISQKLMVPLQMWALLLKLAAGHGATVPKHAMMQRRG
ncbi:unnamed protein product [Cladocopium goreaui]|uniref:Glycosyltransferase n=1 Tax=Cladocopium goreaui TaxID=2562237 RepID=A0A9P1GRI3_9DINO|nr:unnamed protein product [Cladocopium goreaui]